MAKNEITLTVRFSNTDAVRRFVVGVTELVALVPDDLQEKAQEYKDMITDALKDLNAESE